MFEKKVFISHSSKNKEIADHLCAFITRLGVDEKNIFCSSVVGQGIGNGEKLNSAIASAIQKSSLLVFLISYDFISSSYCMEELGVGWYLSQQGKATCYYLVLPDIDLSDLVGFVNSKIDKFSFLDSAHGNELSALSCDLSRQLNLRMKSHTEITNAETVFLSSVKSATELLLLSQKERKQEIEKRNSEIETFKQLLEHARTEIENSKTTIARMKERSEEQDAKIELRTIVDIFDEIGRTSLVPDKQIPQFDKDFWFDWIHRYEELLDFLKTFPKRGGMESLVARIYLLNGNLTEAYFHFLNYIRLHNNFVSIYQIRYFSDRFTESMQSAIELLRGYYESELAGNRKDNLAEAIDYLLKRETSYQKL